MLDAGIINEPTMNANEIDARNVSL